MKFLRKAGIKHILLKGMALEHTLYGSKGLRQMTDCDILIKSEEAAESLGSFTKGWIFI